MKESTREDILNAFPLIEYIESIGVKLRGSGSQKTATRCPAKEHKKDHWCVTVDADKQIFHCNSCDNGGTVVDWMAVERGVNPNEVYKELAQRITGQAPSPRTRWQGEPQGTIAATYEYQDEHGERLFEVVRMDPKDFRQRHMGEDGKWVWNMQGTRRVLYRLPEVLAADEIWICEGEKDADTLTNLGFVATCNVGGAGKWLDAYTESLANKDIVLCGDNDDAGVKHMILVGESLSGKVRSTRTVKIPAPHKDVSDYVASLPDQGEAFLELFNLRYGATQFFRGVDVPVFSLEEIEPRYVSHVQSIQTTALDLSSWLPSLQHRIRSIVPGELILFIADTGVGKTAILSNLALHAAPLATLFFELELPETLLFERMISAHKSIACRDLEDSYKTNGWTAMAEGFTAVSHINVCTKSGLTIPDLERYISRSELKIGKKPQLVLLDYIQLVNGSARSRYEKTSDIAEQLKVLAKQTGVIMIVASQVARRERESPEVTLHEGKDSGSLENSSGLVIGAWRDEEDRATLWMKILKNTKGFPGYAVECNFHGETMRITEKARISPEDVPQYAPPDTEPMDQQQQPDML